MPDLNDEKARNYILHLTQHMAEFQEAEAANDIDRVAKIALDIAIVDRAVAEYCGWVAAVDDIAEETAKKAIQEIQKITIAQDVFENLADFASSVEERSRWRTP